jgi:predicted enzyme related to lactoylglutathione lyase
LSWLINYRARNNRLLEGAKYLIKNVWSITLCVSDIEQSSRFYEQTLGLNKKYVYSSYVGFQCGSVEIGLRPKENLHIGKNGVSIQFSVDNVDEAYNKLKDKGVKFAVKPHDEPWGGRQARFQDPDGNVLELTEINWKKYFEVSSEGA